jgi:serine phosphatase RsbU (regulator of sigma subunit)
LDNTWDEKMMEQPCILIVDDEQFNVDYLEQELEGEGCKILTAGNGVEALEAVLASHPDLILLDIMMPVMDGFSVLIRLKADPSTRDIPVIIISASSDMHSVIKGIKMGAEDFLPKPFEPTLLLARVSSSLEKKRLRDLEKQYLQSLEREFEIASEIQQSFLPHELPVLDGWQIATKLKPAREVAGDFYDAFLLPDGNLVLVVGDVCGKGVGAALFMTLFRSLIRATATSNIGCVRQKTEVDPKALLRRVITFTNEYIADVHGDVNMFATLFAAIIPRTTDKVAYVNCGNEPCLLVHGGKITSSLRPSGPVLGVFPGVDFKVSEFSMTSGDMLVAYTDGITDCLDKENNSFGYERLARVVESSFDTPNALLCGIMGELEDFSSGVAQFDDITLLAARKQEK